MEMETNQEDHDNDDNWKQTSQQQRRHFLWQLLQPGPRIAATFSAQRIIPTKQSLQQKIQEYDTQEFGY